MLSLLRRYFAPYIYSALLVFALRSIQVIAELFLPTLNAEIINEGIIKGDTALVWHIAWQMLAITGGVVTAAVIASYYGAKNGMDLGRDLRDAIYNHVLAFSQQDIDKFGAPSLITRAGSDVAQIQMAVVMLQRMMIMVPAQMIGGAILAWRQDVSLSMALVVVIPLMFIIIGVVMGVTLPMFKESQKRLDRINQVMREKLTGVRVIRAFVRTSHERRRFDEANASQADLGRTINRIMSIMMPAMMLLINATVIFAFWQGGHRIDAGELAPGNLTAFIAYAMQILFSVMFAVMMFVMIPRASASAERIMEVLNTVPSIVDAPDATHAIPDKSQGLVFDRVSFRYPGAEANVLTDISFTLLPGQTVAVIGPTGSGKSTLALLALRFYDVTGGSVHFGGLPLTKIPLKALREGVGFVPQKSFLFQGTVASNLRYGKPDATNDELWEALRIAQASDFVREMPEALDASITQGGGNVSGGQRQRLSIARALIAQPSLLVFDDSFSALDFKTDAHLRAALKPVTKDCGCFIVAQRVSTILHADCILVLEEGRLVGKGRHEELLANCAVYKEIADSQMGTKGGAA